LQIGSKKLPFRAEFTLQSRFVAGPLRFGAGIGTAHLHYRSGIGGLSLAAGYAGAVVPKLSRVHLTQAHLYYEWEKVTAVPVLRLTYDYLRFSPLRGSESALADNHRVRVLAGIFPPLDKHYRLLLTAEPFVYSRQSFLSESRIQIGMRRNISPNLSLDLLYFKRWQKPFSGQQVHRWEHALNIFVHYLFDVDSRHLFHGR
jgi:hypothetical protein